VVALILIALAVLAVLWPPALAYPIALVAAWVGIVLLLRARRLWRERSRRAGDAR
jgi:Flp pilus assembly protein TadB